MPHLALYDSDQYSAVVAMLLTRELHLPTRACLEHHAMPPVELPNKRRRATPPHHHVRAVSRLHDRRLLHTIAPTKVRRPNKMHTFSELHGPQDGHPLSSAPRAGAERAASVSLREKEAKVVAE
eukprot:CAMPEP_0206119964 /NCGR_PEP_ID=MMETSP1472-20131121/213_1 /ASSEMBLY_ACC=CAM_ASM_001108 /TAXON_ID=41880 /ORGANISM="Pycnococcus provasolii, Strain RCC251" /LENGTH=123 /DNA_ID=CAMNT_0053510011 /DNA_START=150 /DNA_END=521 /DNA_ORIENTATION=+